MSDREDRDDDDLSEMRPDADWKEGDHPRKENGEFGSGGGGVKTSPGMSSNTKYVEEKIGSHGGKETTIYEREGRAGKASEKEARLLNANKPTSHGPAATPKKEQEKDHSSKKQVSAEHVAEKIKGMSVEKLRSASSNKDVDPKIRALVDREITSRLISGREDSATVRGMVDQIAGESGRMHRKDAEPNPKAASVAQGGVPNINVAKAIEKVEKDAIVSSAPAAPATAPLASAPVPDGAPGLAAMPVVARAAGVMFVTKDGQALFLKRSGTVDHAGEWCFPGGVIEQGETAEEAARREASEETAWEADGAFTPWVRRTTTETGANGQLKTVDFTTFLQRIDEPFAPKLNDEHVGHAWAPIAQPPEPLHPGCRVALAKLDMDELGLARAIAAGELSSPQHFKNFWLFAMRITGTGVSYREALNEFVYRRPEHYLTDEYLARCNGLPVIMMHPKNATLNSKEFGDRVVGAMMLPYVQGTEVWGVARIYDDAAAAMMIQGPLSTSPSVILRKADHVKMRLEDGSTLLIEGKPALMDHLAICENGVWDKGEGPSGIRSELITAEELAMADDDKKAPEKKADEAEAKKPAEDKKPDADAGTPLDKVLAKMDEHKADTDKRLDAMSARQDAFEKKPDAAKKDADDDKKGEPEEVAADKRKDAADEKKGEKGDDDKKADAAEVAAREIATRALSERIEQVARSIPKSMNDNEFHAMADAQARADNVFVALGQRAPRPLDGENLSGYRRRLANDLKAHSRWKDVPIAAFADDAAFKVAETQIYADAQVAATNPVGLPDGHIRAVTTPDATGRQITQFFGQPKAWMQPFAGTPMRLLRINNGSDRRQ